MQPDSERAGDDLAVEIVRKIRGADRATSDALDRRYRDPLLFAIQRGSARGCAACSIRMACCTAASATR